MEAMAEDDDECSCDCEDCVELEQLVWARARFMSTLKRRALVLVLESERVRAGMAEGPSGYIRELFRLRDYEKVFALRD